MQGCQVLYLTVPQPLVSIYLAIWQVATHVNAREDMGHIATERFTLAEMLSTQVGVAVYYYVDIRIGTSSVK